jgi:hypothetical protein
MASITIMLDFMTIFVVSISYKGDVVYSYNIITEGET